LPEVEALHVSADMSKKKIPHTVAQIDKTHTQQGKAKYENPKSNSNYTQKYDPASTHYGLAEHNTMLSGTLVAQNSDNNLSD